MNSDFLQHLYTQGMVMKNSHGNIHTLYSFSSFYVTQTYYHCRSAMICRDDLELRWRLLMCENEFSHISLLLYISTAF